MNMQSQRFVMTTSVVGSAVHSGEKLKRVEKLEEQVWKCNRTKKFAQGKKSPFVASVLVAGMGDVIPRHSNASAFVMIQSAISLLVVIFATTAIRDGAIHLT